MTPSATYKESVKDRLNRDPGNQPADYDTLSAANKSVLQAWIAVHVQPGRLSRRDSYSVKHDFERMSGGFYITNGQFKGAMLAAGYKPCKEDVEHDINWRFHARFEPFNPGLLG